MVRTVGWSIYRVHVRRLGFFRATVGGWLMYTTVPLFVFMHTLVVLLYSVCIRPALALPRIERSQYLIFDRHTIRELTWFDRLNCLFCEYANGVTLLLMRSIDEISKVEGVHVVRGTLAYLAALLPTAVLVVGMLLTTVPTNILMKLLGLHRGSHKRILTELHAARYAYQLPAMPRKLLYLHKVSAAVIAYNLEQIESQWCPIKHVEREGMLVPQHHERFVERERLDELLETLHSRGTCSKNPPKF